MDNRTRLKATQYIWTGFAIIGIVMMIMSSAIGDFGLGQLIAFLGAAFVTMVSTGTIWNWGDLPTENMASESASQKRKRDDRINRLLASLDDEDLETLLEMKSQRRLSDIDNDPIGISDDGELVRFVSKNG